MSTRQKIILKYATTLLFFVPVFVSAQQVLEEIIVTAQKRAESVQDVPIAISAFSGEQIEELAIGDLRELIEFIPGVEMYDDRGISSQPTWIIRGVGLADLNANNTPTAAIYHDEFYLTSNIMGGIGMFDIERIEVLKGAQGGLYGRNTTGGAVRVESVKPDLGGANGYATGSYGRYDAWSLEGAVGVPLGERAAVRIAALTNQGGGYQDSLVTVDDEPVALSQAQLALLSTFMRHPNQLLTRDQLISLTFNDDFDGFDRAIDSQVARLRRQINRDGRQPIQTVYGGGYRFVADGE